MIIKPMLYRGKNMADITPESSLQEINQKFKDLIATINSVQTTITNLDLLRIQLVYRPGQPEDINLSNFITTCWSKLATYHAVYFDLGSSGTLSWKDMTGQTCIIKTGDYLIKMPDNQSIYIAGNKNQYYYPSGYNDATGQLTFTMTSDEEDDEEEVSDNSTVSVTMPLWAQGSAVGRVVSSTNAIVEDGFYHIYVPEDVDDMTPYIQAGIYYYYGEQVIFPADAITIDSQDGHDYRIAVPHEITGYYIPYYVS